MAGGATPRDGGVTQPWPWGEWPVCSSSSSAELQHRARADLPGCLFGLCLQGLPGRTVLHFFVFSRERGEQQRAVWKEGLRGGPTLIAAGWPAAALLCNKTSPQSCWCQIRPVRIEVSTQLPLLHIQVAVHKLMEITFLHLMYSRLCVQQQQLG